MAENKKGFRFYYDKDFQYFVDCFLRTCHNERQAFEYAKQQIRMYANLWNRDLRKAGFLVDKKCSICESNLRLTIDHKIPICKGGKNEISNVGVLCYKCNIIKGGKI